MIKPTAQRPTKPHIYATEITGRRPMFKTHSNIGHAKTAVKQRAPYKYTYPWNGRTVTLFNDYGWGKNPANYARVFELVDGEWVHVPEFSFEGGDPPMEW